LKKNIKTKWTTILKLNWASFQSTTYGNSTGYRLNLPVLRTGLQISQKIQMKALYTCKTHFSVDGWHFVGENLDIPYIFANEH